MKKMIIYEPAMCCPTGLCGVGVDPELIRVSTIISSLKKSGVEVTRFNLSTSPQEFINNKEINESINKSGIESLPITVQDGEIIITGRYPSKQEFAKLLNVSMKVLGDTPKTFKLKSKDSKKPTPPDEENCCSGSGCCQ